ncbi:MAG: DNRLRE domain-containing protein [Bacilli bacterium]|nr:DNRLRE domain-containing protein [Bacilli bacterium]MDD4411599.1 DNRLRE domain-containing protein [Bacilli bacterium]
MKNKGFTLVELLAAIIILIVVLTISVPIITNIIETARKEAFRATAYSIADAGRLLIANENEGQGYQEFYYLDGIQYNADDKRLDYTGDGPKTGTVVLNDKNKVVLAIHNGTYCATKSANTNKITVTKTIPSDCKATSVIETCDTWEELALQYDISLAELLEANNETDSNSSTCDRNINIPVASDSSSSTTIGSEGDEKTVYRKTYYTVGYISSSATLPLSYEYTIELGVLPLDIKDIEVTRVTTQTVFESLDDFKRYINKRNMREVIWPGEMPVEIDLSQASVFRDHATRTLNMAPDNVTVMCDVETCYATVGATVDNLTNVIPNTIEGVGEVVYTPIKFTVEFNGSELLENKYTINTETIDYQTIYPTFDSSVHISQIIGTQKDAQYFSVLTSTDSQYDERPIMTFDVTDINLADVTKVELFAYYYNGDIPSRQQTHPIRRVIVPWTENDYLTNDKMTSTYTARMKSLNTANYGYGWRSADVTDIVTYWKNNPTENYGLVIDHNRSTSEAGGYWNRMKYYTMESETDYKPHLKVTYKTSIVNKRYVMVPVLYDTSVNVNNTIGANDTATSFYVLSYDVAGYDTRGLLTFDVPPTAIYNISKAELYAYYYNGDIPERQQTHPVRRVIVPWIKNDKLPDSMMTDTYTSRMVSLNPSGYGYGWRSADVTDIITYWNENPSKNYGLIIDHNRGQSNAGGYWNKMSYYSKEANNGNAPYLKIYLEEK